MRTIASRLEVHGVDRRFAALTLGAFVAFGSSSQLSALWLFPNEQNGTYVDSLSIAGVLVPTAVLSQVLAEGLPSVAITARRRLAGDRAAWAAGYAVVLVCGVAGVSAAVKLPWAHMACVAVLLAGLSLTSVVYAGVRLGWVAPSIFVAAFSAPGVVPFDYNMLYRVTTEGILAVASVTVGAAGLLLYAARGPDLQPNDRAGYSDV